MKKIIAFLSLALMISSVTPLANEAAASTKVTTKYVNVGSGTLNVRKSATTNSSVVTKLSKNTSVSVYTESKGWSKIKAGTKSGYVNSKYLTTKKTTAPAPAPASYRTKAIAVAKSELGTPYRWGGISTNGFDCSGLVKYSFGKAGKVLPRTAAEMYTKGTRVSSPATGDLMFFAPNKASRPTHVSIYVGSGTMIHAASSNGVSYSKTSNTYWKPKFIGAKRI
ncbi:cell wall-associated NlpC family hydrolase [Peribacillus deserti]|uniref:Cell wall-associated NlpC family hydrolase n=1 Tax=Peribacillus deserti TaxID=673318 RepID=A0ABS2QIR2_9BACI|nr:SH3 domain-containing C40 family peptidase [Peribacillus deserti]MBM7693046.1 cell wall-associated NlpC family hydrolase [Peribacillus deserti]